jgi:hypothetical protein
MLRFGVAFCAVCVGGLTAAADLAVSLPLLPPKDPNVPYKQSREEELLIFEACVTFYGIVYTTGRLLYRWRRAHAEAEELRKWSRAHMIVLNLLAGCFLVGSGWQSLQLAGVLRPSLVVGVLLVALGARDGWRAVRLWRAGPHGLQ